MSDVVQRVADVVAGPLGVAWIERSARGVVVASTVTALDCTDVTPAWARPGNGGVLAMGSSCLWVLCVDGSVVRVVPGRGIEHVATVPGVRWIAGSPAGAMVAVVSDARVVVFDDQARLVNVMDLGRLGVSDLWDVAIDDDGSIALARAGEREPWLTGSVMLLDPTGAIVGHFGGDGASVVEPRFGPGGLWVRDDRAGAHVPILAGRVPQIAGLDYDVGEYPLGPGRRGYIPDSEAVLGVIASVEAPALVVLDESLRRVASGSWTSISAIDGDVVGIERGPWSERVRRGSETLRQAGSDGVDGSRIEPLRALGLAARGVAIWPPVPRGVALVVHGGPVEQVAFPVPDKWRRALRHGLVVVAVDYPGSYGYGRSARERIVGRFGTVEAEALAEVVRGFEGVVAGPRVGIGASSAGWTLLQLILEDPTLLDALVLTNPLLDPSALGDVDWLVGQDAPHLAHRRPRRRIPVLITHGSADRVVPVEQSRAFVERVGESLACELQVAEGEGHSLGERASLEELARFDALVLGLLASWSELRSR